jgi:LPXTG-motif cell wall-anchored protein
MPNINRKEQTLMSELQGPRIPGEERSGSRRPLGWIIGGLLALLLLALLIPFACQALGEGSDSQGQGPGTQEKALAQEEADDGKGGGDGARDADGAKNTDAAGTRNTDGAKNTDADGTGEIAQAQPAEGDGSQDGKESAAGADGAAAGSAAEEDGAKTPDERGEVRTGGDLPDTGGMSPATLLLVGMILLLMGSTGLSAVVRRRSASRV